MGDQPVNASIVDAVGVGTIIDDDTAVGSITGPGTVFEGTPAVFTISLSNPADRTITIAYSTQDGTATAPGDYTATSGTLTFAPLETTKTVSVTTIADTTFETDETFQMNAAGSVSMTPGFATATIRDAAFIPTLSIWMLLLLAVALVITALITHRP